MRKINKIIDIALIFTLIGVAVCQEAYGLRVPMDIPDDREQAALKENSIDSKNLVLVSQVTTEKRYIALEKLFDKGSLTKKINYLLSNQDLWVKLDEDVEMPACLAFAVSESFIKSVLSLRT